MRTFQISREQYSQMEKHVDLCFSEEGCGLIGGKNNKAELVCSTENIFHSPTSFKIKPEDQLTCFLQLEELGIELIGIYHSHPAGPSRPSERDIEEFFYPGVVMLIWSRATGTWIVRVFEIENGKVMEVRLELH
jgi:[CysO sulfur-carrier protein]-S-L-cysteine hydrolase